MFEDLRRKDNNMLKIDVEEMDRKAKFLENVKNKLKGYFVGIDDMIDMIFSNLEVWYFMPELLTRPTIINLWGMTGVGKTDLVRKLVKELHMEENYAEIQLNNKPRGWQDSIQEIIEDRGIQSNYRGVLLLDEIQRFRSIDEDGRMIHEYAYDDIWALLSDGKFTDSMREKNRLYMMLMDFMYDQDSEYDEDEDEDVKKDSDTEKPKKKQRERKYKSTLYTARRFKRILELDESIAEIMTWPLGKKIAAVEEKIEKIEKSKDIKSYSKMLIFICGNLDEAYRMSKDTSETNVDADILHEFSKKISILDIKDCLLRKFKPEQIARFGNNHVIYPSLSKSSFETIILDRVNDIRQRTKDSFSIVVDFSENINKAIYRNGVYPAQGVRPVLSTINSLIENSLPFFLFNSVLMNSGYVFIDINEKKSTLFAKISDKEFTRKIDLQIDKLKKEVTEDEVANISVHEAGHAVIYSLLFKLAPAQIVGDAPTAIGAGGFLIPHNMLDSADGTLKMIRVLLAGAAAEEIVFGKPNTSAGAYSDLSAATSRAAEYVRNYGFDKYPGKIATERTGDEYVLTMITDTNKDVLSILCSEKDKAKELLIANIAFLKKVSKKVMEVKRLLPEEFYEIAKEFVPDIKVKDNSYRIIKDYNTLAKKFINE